MIDTKVEVTLKLNLSQFRELALMAKLVDEIADKYDSGDNDTIDSIWNKYVFALSSDWIHNYVNEYNDNLKLLTVNSNPQSYGQKEV